jgi:hypothetical protein
MNSRLDKTALKMLESLFDGAGRETIMRKITEEKKAA